MFDFIRTHQRLMQILLLLLIIPSFVLVGMSSYRSFGDSANTVATVDDLPITQQEWDNAVRQQGDQMRQTYGAQFDPKMLETPEAKNRILDELVAERAKRAEIRKANLTVVNDVLVQQLRDQPAFKDAKGNFDYKIYESKLAMVGLTPGGYESNQREAMIRQQFDGAIAQTGFVARSVAARISDTQDQEREVQELMFPATEFVSQVKLTDDMVKDYYNKNIKLFEVPEQLTIDYVIFSKGELESQVTVDDAEVDAFYKGNAPRFTSKDERHASHILITVKAGASAADKAAAKAKADAIAAKLHAAPADFAKVAKTDSEDAATRDAGGDLGPIDFGKDASLPPSVLTAISKLKQGEVSDVVPSDFGFHIITLTALKPAALKPLDQVRGEIVAELKAQKAAKEFTKQTETFSDMVDGGKDLKAVADKLKLKIQTAAGITRTPSPRFGDAPFNNAKFLTAVFKDDALAKKRNTEAVEVAPGTMIAGHVNEFKPATKRPLADVDAPIRMRLTQEEALKLAKKAGDAKIAAVKTSGDAAGFGEAKVVTRTKEPTINQAAALEVLRADVSKLPAYIGVEIPGQGYGVYRIGKVGQPAQLDVARRQNEQGQINNLVAQQELASYIEAIKLKAKAHVVKRADAKTAATPAAQ